MPTSIDLDPKSIIVPEDRQRRDFTIEDLLPSIKAKGVIQPIVVRAGNILVAGERRLRAVLELGLDSIPVRDFGDLSEIEREEIELEENIKRKSLTWQEECLATLRLHKLYAAQSGEGEDWPKAKTAARINMSERNTSRRIMLGEAIAEGDESIIKSDTMASAATLYERRHKRAMDEAFQQILEIKKPSKPSVPSSGSAVAHDSSEVEAQEEGEPDLPPAAPHRIECADAIEFFKTYDGDRFNLLHCDLPYGVELHGQANQDSFGGGGYDSNATIYWDLCAAICDGWERVMFPSAHIMFWFSFLGNDGEGFYQQTMEYFESRLPQLRFQRNPLVWMKSDNRGILPDAKRGPRNVCEFALLGATGDRHIVKPVANAYACPTGKADSIHTNEKPQPMLNHFFSMLVDEHTRLLDPTCGSGSAIQCAEAAGAELALGLEFNPDFAERAQRRLIQARTLRALSEKKEAIK